ncbi:hypothetical protein A616_17015 [Brevibacillus brevis X23]|nr:hypothetical protein A616_17015 [Brevibacillus brevis X23]
MDTKELIMKQYETLKEKHQFFCDLIEEELDEHYSMLFDPNMNSIVYDCSRIEEVYKKGKKYGFYDFDLSTFILLGLVHEIGHYYDHEENPEGFRCSSKEEYLQLEIRGMRKAEQIIPKHLSHKFKIFNQLILDSYQKDLPE